MPNSSNAPSVLPERPDPHIVPIGGASPQPNPTTPPLDSGPRLPPKNTSFVQKNGGRNDGKDRARKIIEEEIYKTLGIKTPLQFEPDFKNPCWYEPIPRQMGTMYADNHWSDNRVLSGMLNTVKKYLIFQREARHKTHYLRCLPYFYLVGVAKSGTTDLYDRITQHPDVSPCILKEPQWWGRRNFGAKENFTPFSQYVELFDVSARTISDNKCMGCNPKIGPTHTKITGEASPTTFWFNDYWDERLGNNVTSGEPTFVVADYMKQLQPHAKIIIILRDPVERVYSDFLYLAKDVGKNPQVFHKAVVEGVNVFKDCQSRHTVRSCIHNRTVRLYRKWTTDCFCEMARLSIGVYHVHLADWLRAFGQQVLVLRFEDYITQPVNAMRRVFRFLDLRPLSKKEEKSMIQKRPKNKTLFKTPMWRKTKDILKHFYKPHNQELAKLLGDIKFNWDGG